MYVSLCYLKKEISSYYLLYVKKKRNEKRRRIITSKKVIKKEKKKYCKFFFFKKTGHLFVNTHFYLFYYSPDTKRALMIVQAPVMHASKTVCVCVKARREGGGRRRRRGKESEGKGEGNGGGRSWGHKGLLFFSLPFRRIIRLRVSNDDRRCCPFCLGLSLFLFLVHIK